MCDHLTSTTSPPSVPSSLTSVLCTQLTVFPGQEGGRPAHCFPGDCHEGQTSLIQLESALCISIIICVYMYTNVCKYLTYIYLSTYASIYLYTYVLAHVPTYPLTYVSLTYMHCPSSCSPFLPMHMYACTCMYISTYCTYQHTVHIYIT